MTRKLQTTDNLPASLSGGGRIRDALRCLISQRIERAPHRICSHPEHMRVDHRRLTSECPSSSWTLRMSEPDPGQAGRERVNAIEKLQRLRHAPRFPRVWPVVKSRLVHRHESGGKPPHSRALRAATSDTRESLLRILAGSSPPYFIIFFTYVRKSLVTSPSAEASTRLMTSMTSPFPLQCFRTSSSSTSPIILFRI